MIRLYVIAGVILAAVAIAGVQTWRLHTAQLALANIGRDHALQLATDNADAVKDWRSEWDRQQAADLAQHVEDAATDQRTAQAIQDIGNRYAGLVQEIAPKGTCTLSPEWIKRFNEAR